MSNTNNNIELLIQLGVDNVNSRKNINQYIKELKNLDKVKVELHVDGISQSSKEIDKLQGQVDKLGSSMSSYKLKVDTNEAKKQLDNVGKSLEALKNDALAKGGTLKIDTDSRGIITQVTQSFKNAQNEVQNIKFKPTLDFSGNQIFNEVKGSLSNVMNTDTAKAYDKASKELKEIALQGNIAKNVIKDFEDGLLQATSIKGIQSIVDKFKLMNKELTSSLSKTASLQKFTKEVEKLHSKGFISGAEKTSFINEASLKSNTKEIQNLLTNIQRIGQSVDSFNKIKNATESTKESVSSLNDRLNLAINNLGSNINTSKLDVIKNKMLELSNLNIVDEASIKKANGLIDSVNRRITALSTSGNGMERFNNTITKATDALDKMEREGFASGKVISDLRNQLNSVEIGNLSKAKEALRDINKEMQNISEKNSMQKGVREVQNSIIRLQSDLQKTINLYKKSVNYEEAGNIGGRIENISKMPLNNLSRISSAKDQIAQVREEIKRLNAEATIATRNSMSIMDSFATAMSKFPVWMAASTIFYSSINSAKEFVRIIVDIDTKLTNISKVMSEDMDMSTVLDNATQSAERFG